MTENTTSNTGWVEEYFAQGGTLSEINNISEKTLEAIYTLAHQHYSNGHYMKAAEQFSYSCFYNQWNPKYFIGLGACQQMMTAYDQALKTFTYALKMDPDNPIPMVYIGDCYQGLKQVDNAILAYKTAVDLAENQHLFHDEITKAKKYISALDGHSEENES